MVNNILERLDNRKDRYFLLSADDFGEPGQWTKYYNLQKNMLGSVRSISTWIRSWSAAHGYLAAVASEEHYQGRSRDPARRAAKVIVLDELGKIETLTNGKSAREPYYEASDQA